MIDPTKMTEYDASRHRLEEIALFSLLAANNNALSAARGLEKFLNRMCEWMWLDRRTGPFKLINVWFDRYSLGEPYVTCGKMLKECGIGKYTKKGRGVVDLAASGINLRTCTQAQLEEIYNIGPKTSRFFILHTRLEANSPEYVALDTHMLSYMRDQGYDVPDNTPGNMKVYRRIANQFFKLSQKSGKTLAEFDLNIWNEYSGHNRRKRNEEVQTR
jgi:hypothetical protein